MTADLVLNELSLQAPAADIRTARRYMTTFVGTIGVAVRAGASRTLRTESGFGQLEVAPGYPIDRWRNDPDVEREQRSYLRSVTSKAPYLDSLSDRRALDRSLAEEVRFSGKVAHGLGAAFWLEGLAVSFASATDWAASQVTVILRALDDYGEPYDQDEIVRHASEANHVADHSDWIRSSARPKPTHGLGLWEARADLFSHLSFCDSVRENLTSILEGDPAVPQVVKRLRELDEYAEKWISGPFDAAAFRNATSQSESTLREYAAEHTFVCPDGQSRQFSWHLRCTPGAVRVHFLPIDHAIIIGYIGPHLPTVRFN